MADPEDEGVPVDLEEAGVLEADVGARLWVYIMINDYLGTSLGRYLLLTYLLPWRLH